MTEHSPAPRDQGSELLALYDRALPEVYGYLMSRCGNTVLAEDLTSESSWPPSTRCGATAAPRMAVAWLIGVARHKLVDHWRRVEREQRRRRSPTSSSPTRSTTGTCTSTSGRRAVLADLGPTIGRR